MPKNIFAKYKKEQEIFKDERVLYPEHLPEKLPHRDAEIDNLVFALNPVLKGRKPQNVFVFGKTGTGKTAAVKYVLNELEEYSDRARSIYINCFEYNTRHSILSSITNFLGEPIPRRGTATDEVYAKMLEAAKRVDFTPIIVLDEVDQLLGAEEASRLFYDLLRIIEHEKARFGLIFISNDFSFTAKLDARVKSSLVHENLEFKQYSPTQLKDILRERGKYAFFPNALEAEVINVAAAHASKLGGDARIALESLLKAGRLAEKENAAKVSLQHLKKSFSSVDFLQLEKILPKLNEQERFIIQLVAKSPQPSINSGALYADYSKKSKKPLTQRRFRDIVTRLESMNLIAAPHSQVEGRGKTRKISLTVEKEKLLKELK